MTETTPDPKVTKDAEDAAQESADPGMTEAQVRAAATEAAREALAEDPKLSSKNLDEIADRIADRQLERMEKRGVFDPSPAEPVPPATGTESEPQHATPDDGTPVEDEAPKKRSFAAKFMGQD